MPPSPHAGRTGSGKAASVRAAAQAEDHGAEAMVRSVRGGKVDSDPGFDQYAPVLAPLSGAGRSVSIASSSMPRPMIELTTCSADSTAPSCHPGR